MTLRSFNLLLAEYENQERMMDFRCYRIMQAQGCKAEPGEVFPSLKELPGDASMDVEDLSMTAQTITAMLMQAAGPAEHRGR